MERQLTVDFNRTIAGSRVRANTRRAEAGGACLPGSIIVAGDDDWGVAQAEIVVEHEPETGLLSCGSWVI